MQHKIKQTRKIFHFLEGAHSGAIDTAREKSTAKGGKREKRRERNLGKKESISINQNIDVNGR